MNKNGFTPIGIIIGLFLVLILASIGLYLRTNNQKNFTPNITGETTIKTKPAISKINLPLEEVCSKTTSLTDSAPSDWLTYTNQYLGFSIKYPSNLIVEESYYKYDPSNPNIPEHASVELWRKDKWEERLKILEQHPATEYFGPYGDFNISVWSNPTKLSLTDWMINAVPAYSNFNSTEGCLSRMINNMTSITYPVDGMIGGSWYQITIQKPDKSQIGMVYIGGEKLDPQAEKILSTFQFSK